MDGKKNGKMMAPSDLETDTEQQVGSDGDSGRGNLYSVLSVTEDKTLPYPAIQPSFPRISPWKGKMTGFLPVTIKRLVIKSTRKGNR
jgi:hypothetical protein